MRHNQQVASLNSVRRATFLGGELGSLAPDFGFDRWIDCATTWQISS